MKSLILPIVMAGLAALGVPAASAQDGVRNIVLVHGSFADASSWNSVAAILSAKGYNVTAVDIPLTSLADDVAATRAAIEAQDGPTVLVGHSWGGVVIGEAGNSDKVSSLVYVSAFVPDRGEVLGALVESLPPADGAKSIRPNDAGLLIVDPAAFPNAFAADLPLPEAEVLAANQRPFNPVGFGTPIETAAWHDKPNFYVVFGEDQMIAPAAQTFFAERIGAKVTEVPASHAGMIARPEEVAKAIEDAAQ